MKPKTLTAKNGNGHHSEAETLTEIPSSGPDPYMSAALSNETTLSNETEQEEVGGFILRKRGEADKETANKASVEADELTELEEAGSDNPETESAPVDALFASYSELMPLMETQEFQKHLQEVIIGVDNRVRVNPPNVFPWRAICGLKITAKDGSRWIGTGWLVAPRTVITAGHCVFMHDHGGWPSKVEVIPGLNDASRPYGSFMGTTFRSVVGWTNDKNRNYDYGAIILPSSSRPGDQVGYFGYSVKDDPYLLSSILNLSGYPGDKGGNQQWFMALKAKSVSSRVITYDIDTMGGQSGAPVWIKVGSARYVVGIHTNGHNTGNSATRIVKPVFDNIKAWKALGM